LRHLLCCILLLTAFYTVKGKVNQPMVDSFYVALYSYHFNSAEKYLQQIVKTENDRGVVDLLEITYQWWLVISGENNPSGVEPLLTKIDRSINHIVNKNTGSELTQGELLQLIAMYSFKSRVNNLARNRLSGYSAFSTSLDYFEQLAPCTDTDCDMYNFIAGMYYSLGGFMKKEHPSLFFLVFDSKYADKEKGHELLQRGIQSENLQVRTESTYFMMKLFMDVEENPAGAQRYAEMLIGKFPENLVFRFTEIELLKAQEMTEKMDNEFAALQRISAENSELSERQKQHFKEEYIKLDQ
jgi:hypothetical protein